MLDFLFQVCDEFSDKIAIVWQDQEPTFSELRAAVNEAEALLKEQGIPAGAVVGLTGDFSPAAVAMLLALIDGGYIVVPMMRNMAAATRDKYHQLSELEWSIEVDEDDRYHFTKTGRTAGHLYFKELRERKHPGLVLFTSGSSGEPKGAVHDFTGLLEKFKHRRPTLNMLNFLMWDHWGGLNTLLHTLSNGGTVYTVQDRSPDAICGMVEKYRIEVLPASPTFLNLLLMSEAYQRYDLSCLRVITYGAEPMPETTLKRLHAVFPDLKLQQTYGLIELGVFRSKSKSSDSLWVKLDMDYRIVDGILHIKTKSAMLGYLNAPSPFTEDGYFITGDAVEVDGEYLRILGRKSEMINVGGEKVYPQEVENVIQEMDNVKDVVIYKEKSPLVGNIVCAKVVLNEEENKREFVKRLKKFCRERLQPYKVPVKVELVDDDFMSHRGKKRRFGV